MTRQQIDDLLRYINLVSECAARGRHQPSARHVLEEMVEIAERLRASAKDEEEDQL